MQIDKKDFQELLKEIQQYNKIDLVAQAIQTKYAKEMAGEDHEERLKAQQDSNELLKKIYEAIQSNGKQTEKVANKVDKLSKEFKTFKPVSGIKDDKPTTIREELKSLVAGTKKFGSDIKSALTGLTEQKRTPSGDIKAAGGFIERVGKAGKDILDTSKDYTVEGGRFAEAYSRTAEGTRYQEGGKGSLEVGLENYNELKAKEKEIKAVQQKINEQKKYGFEPNKGDVEQLEKLKKQHSKLDIRNKEAPVEKKVDKPKSEMAAVERKLTAKEKYVQASVTEEQKKNIGEFAATRQAEKEYDKNVKNYGELAASQNAEKLYEKKFPTTKQETKDTDKSKSKRKGKAENPNIVDEPGEVVAEEAKKQNITFKELLDTTKESLDQLKAIRASLEGPPASQPEPPQAKPTPVPTEATGEGGGLSPLDLLGRGGAAGGAAGKAAGAAGAAKAGFGAKALGALKTGGAMLGKGAMVAGKAVAGAALAKPALIAAGVGLAAYGAYKGYQALTSKDEEQQAEGKNPFVEQAKKSREAQALKKLNEEGKYTFEPKGRTVFVYDKESGKLVRSIEAPKEITGAELIQAAEIGSQAGNKTPAEATSPKTAPTEEGPSQATPKPTETTASTTPTEKTPSFGDKLKSFFGFGKKEEPPIEGRQAGGPVTEGKPYVVGEEGPEIVVPNESGKVDNNAKYEQVAAQAKEVNQKYGKMQEGDLGDGVSKRATKGGGYRISGGFGTYEYSSGGSFISYQTPTFGGASAKVTSKEEGGIEAGGGSIETSYNAGPLSTKQKTSLSGDQLSSSMRYDMGPAVVSAKQEGTGPVSASMQVRGGAEENAALRDEMTAQGGGQPVVMNNVSSNNTTTYIPMKGEPRPGSRGSALDRYSDRVAAY